MSDESDDDIQFEDGIIFEEMLQTFEIHRRRRLSLNKDDPIRNEKPIPGGVAAFHALYVISLRDDQDDDQSDREFVEIPRWVFGELLSAWKYFLLLGSGEKDRKTLGQVVGCEATYQGGREGAKFAQQKFDEVRYVTLMNIIRRLCHEHGHKVSNEELVGLVADLSSSTSWPPKKDSTLRRYIEKTFKKQTKR